MVRELQKSPSPSAQCCSLHARQAEIASRCDGQELDCEVGKLDFGSASSPLYVSGKWLNLTGLPCFSWEKWIHSFIHSYIFLKYIFEYRICLLGLPRRGTTDWAAYQAELYCLTALEARSPKSQCQQGRFHLRAVREGSPGVSPCHRDGCLRLVSLHIVFPLCLALSLHMAFFL